MAEDDEDQTMDLTIEALTGTIYDLCVSPYETILGIKMKIQRLEGTVMKIIETSLHCKDQLFWEWLWSEYLQNLIDYSVLIYVLISGVAL